MIVNYSSKSLKLLQFLSVHFSLVVLQGLRKLQSIVFDIGLQFESSQIRDIIERKSLLIEDETISNKLAIRFKTLSFVLSDSFYVSTSFDLYS